MMRLRPARALGILMSSSLLAWSVAGCVAPTPTAPWYGMSRSAQSNLPLRWHWSASPDDLPLGADIYVLDVFDTPAATVTDAHQAERRAVCYLEVGMIRPDRPDRDRFPAELLRPDGQTLVWDRHDKLTPIVADELRLCADKGFDGVVLGELATVPRDVLTYLIEEAHRRDLPVALVDRVHPRMDFTVPAPPGEVSAGSAGRSTTTGS
jgi:hypothetical protein